MIELRIEGGARAGERVRIDGDVVLIGRHPDAQLQLDPNSDLDVSARHAELRRRNGEWFIADLGSTNGTFMHGVRVEGEWAIQDGDVITLGPRGIAIAIHTSAASVASSVPASVADAPAAAIAPPRRPTGERIAIAVQHETAKLRRGLMVAAGLVIVGVGGAYWVGHRESTAQLEELRQMLAQNDASSSLLRARMAGVTDPSILAALGKANDDLHARVASGKLDDGQAAELRAELLRSQQAQRSLAGVDLPSINDRNAPATAFVVAELDGKPYAGTAFNVSSSGLLVTNRHLVRSEGGSQATRLAVKFRDTKVWIPAHVVKVAASQDDDLALLQLDQAGSYPVIAGVSTSHADMREGAPIVTIGYPLGLDTRMEGTGEDFVAKSTLFPGTVSKQLSTLIQVAAWAGHGSSGSPVIGASGRVIGVVWGGPRDSNGQLVYAVPGDRLAAFVAAEAPSVLR